MRTMGILALVALSGLGCGGTGSETPWPVEPSNTTLGPAGEVAPSPGLVPNEAAAPPEEPADAGAPPAREDPGAR